MKNNKENWPDFILIGAAKSGTTSLYQYFKQTSGIFMSEEKMPGFFNSVALHMAIKNKEKYLKLFSKAKKSDLVGEATHRYISDPKSAELIKNTLPNVKIIVSLRDPVDRAYSQYFNRLRRGDHPIPFGEYFKKSIEADLAVDYELAASYGRWIIL